MQITPAELPRVRPALLAKGFRPFFLLAAGYGAGALVIWLLALNGAVDLGAYFGGMYWHAHEMIFGFTLAVIAGFLLTAIGNWTGIETAVGVPLAALVGLWMLGRVAVLFASTLPYGLAAVIDLAFLPVLVLVCARPVFASASRRNYQFVAMLAALFLANLGMHLGALGIAPLWVRRGAWVGVDVITLMIIVMSARIVPMFTRNATGIESIRNLPSLDNGAALVALSVLVFDVSAANEAAAVVLSVAAGVLVAARSVTWGTRHTLRHPLLWVLHAGHALVALGLVLRGVAFVEPRLTPGAALHALTAGGIGLMTLGMMARVSLGHSGRQLKVGSAMVLSFAMVLVSALVRVVGPLFGLSAYLPSMMLAGSLFAVGFAIYFVVYLPMLMAPRVDGKPG